MDVDQSPAGVAGVDRGIGLDEILEGVDAQLTAPQGRHDAAGDGLPDPERIADGQDLVTDLQLIGLAPGDDRQAIEFDAQYRQVAVGVGADDFGAGTAAVGEHHFDFCRPLDDVVVGEDVPLRADDDATAQAGLGARVRVAKKETEPGVGRLRMALGGFEGVDAHHSG